MGVIGVCEGRGMGVRIRVGVLHVGFVVVGVGIVYVMVGVVGYSFVTMLEVILSNGVFFEFSSGGVDI